MFPRLAIFYLARLTHWNVKYEMVLQVAIICCTVATIWVVWRRASARPSDRRSLVPIALCALLLFSPVQWWNFLFGIQIVVFIPMCMLCVALAAGRRFVVAAICCFVATYSYANGMLLWILVGVWLFARREDRKPKLIAVWVAVAAVSIGAYFIGYQRPPVSPKLISPMTHPFEAAQFVLAFLGHPLCWTDALWPNVVIGLVGLLLFFALTFGAKREALPWFLIGSYAVVSACGTSLGRLGFGDWAALEPRYTSFAIAMWVAVVMLGAASGAAGFSPLNGGLKAAAPFVLLMMHVLAAYSVWPKIRESNRDRLIARTAVQFSQVMPNEMLFARLVYRDVPQGVAILKAVSTIGYLKLNDSPVVSSAGPIPGDFEGIFRVGPHQWVMYGWASRFDSVLIARDNRIVAISERTVGRSDRPGLGWDLPFTRRLATPGAVYNAFAYDTEKRRAYRLNGELRLGTR